MVFSITVNKELRKMVSIVVARVKYFFFDTHVFSGRYFINTYIWLKMATINTLLHTVNRGGVTLDIHRKKYSLFYILLLLTFSKNIFI